MRRGGKKRSLKHQLANCLFQYRNTPHSVTGVTPSELFLKRKPRTKFSILLPNMEEHIQNQQSRQQRQHGKSHVKLRELSPRDSVNVRNTRGGMEKWVPGTVIRRLGPLTYLVRVGRQLRYVHIDHLLQTNRVNCEEAFEEVVPEESSVSVPGSSSPLTVSVPSTSSKVSGSSTLPSPSVAVSKTTLDQPAETRKPVAEPIPHSSTGDSLSAQEPVSVSPEQFPVAVPELERPSPVQHPSETSPRNTPIRAERRYPARERKARDRLNL